MFFKIGEITPDGHRAPVPGISNMRSIDTQTPRDTQEDSDGNGTGSRSHSVSPSSPLDGSRPSSRSSSAGNGDNKESKGKFVQTVDSQVSSQMESSL